MQISQMMTSYTTKFCSNMMKRDISANLYQKFLIFCSKILLNVPHNMSLTVQITTRLELRAKTLSAKFRRTVNISNSM